jgi:hypothetical protein
MLESKETCRINAGGGGGDVMAPLKEGSGTVS